jgi:hypothetical protein
MAINNTDEGKSAKEALRELLGKKPKIYQDAVKYTFACRIGIRASAYFDDNYFSGVARDAALKELQENGSIWLEFDPKGDSEVIVHLTEQERDNIIDLFYSGKEKKELKRLLKKFDAILASKSAPQAKT